MQAYQLNNVSTIEPLRITLVWSDPKAANGSAVALVNNLDLEVIDPQGTVYRGNANFANAWSQPANGATFDNRNPVEAVYIQFPQPGTYTVRVIGANVPGNGQTQMLAQPGDQRIDSNRQGYALIATGNFTAGAQPIASLTAVNVTGGVNADRFISRNETVTAQLTISDPAIILANGVIVQIAVDAASAVPASVVRLNGQAAGQAITLAYGDIAAQASKTLAFQITLLDDGVNRSGQATTFKVTMTPANGSPTTTQFTITAGQRLITYRTRFEPTADPGGEGVIVIPENEASFTNLLLLDSTTPATGGFRHFAGNSFATGDGVFAVNTTTPNNSDVAFRLELQLRRNGVSQTGVGVFCDNLVVRLRVADTNVYAVPTATSASVDAASFARAAAPGQILALFGAGLPNFTEAAAGMPCPHNSAT